MKDPAWKLMTVFDEQTSKEIVKFDLQQLITSVVMPVSISGWTKKYTILEPSK